MIFKQVLVDQILAGNKTQTRRPVNFEKPRSHYWHERCLYRPGRRFIAQANYKAGQSWPRLEVTGLRREPVGAITLQDAWAEGFPLPESGMARSLAIEAFLEYVEQLHDDIQKKTKVPIEERTPLDRTAEFWVIEFRRIEEAGA